MSSQTGAQDGYSVLSQQMLEMVHRLPTCFHLDIIRGTC